MASILVSEADPDVRRLFVVLMERLGHEAIVLARHLEIPPRGDLLLLEPTEPWCVEQARLARGFLPGLPIVCMGTLPDDAAFLTEGVVVQLEKPFTIDALRASVSALTVPASPSRSRAATEKG